MRESSSVKLRLIGVLGSAAGRRRRPTTGSLAALLRPLLARCQLGGVGGLGFGLDPRFDLGLGCGCRRQARFSAARLLGQVHALRRVTRDGRFRWLDQLRHFGLELGFQLLGVAVTHRAVTRGVGMRLGHVQAHRAQLQQAHLPGVAQHLDEDRFDLLQEALAEAVDDVVIRMRVRRDVAKSDRVIARPLRRPAGEGADSVAVEQQRHQHRLGGAHRCHDRRSFARDPTDPVARPRRRRTAPDGLSAAAPARSAETWIPYRDQHETQRAMDSLAEGRRCNPV